VNLIKLFIFWNLDILLQIFAKIKKEEILFPIIQLLGGKPVLVYIRKKGKKKWGILYIDKITYK
jgi:hypothetical protein